MDLIQDAVIFQHKHQLWLRDTNVFAHGFRHRQTEKVRTLHLNKMKKKRLTKKRRNDET